MGRNIRVKTDLEICSTRTMRVPDDENYDNRCDEFTIQGLNRGPKPLVIRPGIQGEVRS